MNSNKKEDSLFLLIKSLTRNEKRFFTLYSKLFNQNKTPNYLHLFNILDNMSEYNQEFVLDELKKNTDNNHLPQIKRYLKVNLLESLKQYDKKNQDHIKRLNQILRIEILFNKDLTRYGIRMAQKQKEVCIENEKHLDAHLINTILIKSEKQQIERSFKSHQEVNKYSLESIELLEKQIEIQKLCETMMQVRLILYNKERIAKEINIELEQILKQNLLTLNPIMLKSERAKYLYYDVCFIIYMSLNQHNQVSDIISKQYDLLNSFHFQKIDDAHFIVRINYLTICTIQKKFPQYQIIKSELDELFLKYPFYKKLYISWFYLNQLEYYFAIEAPHLPKKFVSTLFEDIKDPEIGIHIIDQNKILSQLAKYYLSKQQIENARNILLKITIDQKLSTNDLNFLKVKVMNIICLYELDLQEITNRELLALKRKLKRENLLNTQLSTLLKLLKQLNNATEKRKRQYYQKINAFLIERCSNNETLFNKDLSFLTWWVAKKAQ